MFFFLEESQDLSTEKSKQLREENTDRITLSTKGISCGYLGRLKQALVQERILYSHHNSAFIG